MTPSRATSGHSSHHTDCTPLAMFMHADIHTSRKTIPSYTLEIAAYIYSKHMVKMLYVDQRRIMTGTEQETKDGILTMGYTDAVNYSTPPPKSDQKRIPYSTVQ